MRFHLSLSHPSQGPILFSLAMLLAGCAPSLGTLAVNLKEPLEACRKLDPKVVGPGPSIGRKSDYRDLSPEALAALKKANDGTSRRNRCEDKVIESYAGAK